MHVALWLVVLAAVVTATSAVSHRLALPAPLVLTVVGIGASFVPGVPQVQLSPTVVLVGFLPPLLYAAALRSSLVEFRRNRRPISFLSVGLVIINTVVVGVVVWWLLPVPPAAAFALGAVVGPPDAVAATSVARRVGMPRRLVTILEGEGLVNDGTALVALRTAIAAIGGTVTVGEVLGGFVLSVVGGVVIGIVVAYAVGAVRARIEDNLVETSISMMTPFVAYLVAEEAHASGVLAVVTVGLMLAHKSHLLQSASSRIFERNTWLTVQFLLENAVFLLIGLEVRQILEAAGASDLPPGLIVTACIVVPAVVILIRIAAVFPAAYLSSLVPWMRRPGETALPWQYPAAVSWAGMRGVVTLAAAFVLPESTPHRETLILLAMVVTAVTLLLQGSTLPSVLRALGLQGPDPDEDALQAASVQQRVSGAGLNALDELLTGQERSEVVDRLRRRAHERSNAYWERLGGTAETPNDEYVRLRLEMIDAERAELVRIRDSGSVPPDVLKLVQASIDIEETVLERLESVSPEEREEELTAPVTVRNACQHLVDARRTPTPRTPDGCEECLQQGMRWVHLRLCMACGHVGCCDSSPGKHGTRHYEETHHPVMRSFEPGEAWRWCFVDHRLG